MREKIQLMKGGEWGDTEGARDPCNTKKKNPS